MNTRGERLLALVKGAFSRNEMIFGLSFVLIFFATFCLLYVLGLIPTEFQASSDNPSIVEKLQDKSLEEIGLSSAPSGTDSKGDAAASNVSKSPAEEPIRIEAPAIGLNFNVVNPSTTDYVTLDNSLTKGAVHYPGSGDVDDGNMFIFGHSTGYKVVNNKAYQVFNNIHSLKTGDEIHIYTTDKEYVYKVLSVQLVDSREELVDFSDTSHMLTLSTCNSFGEKTDRYVVKAQFDHTIDI